MAPRAGQGSSPGALRPPPAWPYLAGAARPPGRRRHSRCSSSAGGAGTRSQPGSAPPGRRRGAASAGAAGSGRRGAAGRLPPRPAGRASVSRAGRPPRSRPSSQAEEQPQTEMPAPIHSRKGEGIWRAVVREASGPVCARVRAHVCTEKRGLYVHLYGYTQTRTDAHTSITLQTYFL